jgi:hypothetical protein
MSRWKNLGVEWLKSIARMGPEHGCEFGDDRGTESDEDGRQHMPLR